MRENHNDRVREIVGIQYLRGIAALLVVFDHLAGMIALPKYFNNQALVALFSPGAIGVDLFFVISGFIIVYVSLSGNDLSPRLNFLDFSRKRFSRIFPFLWFCVISYAILRFVGRGVFDYAPYVRALFLYPLGDVNPNQVWTLRHEVLFYIIFGLSFLLKNGCRLPLILWFAAPFAVYFFDLKFQDDGFFKFFFHNVNVLFLFGFLSGLIFLRWKDSFSVPFLKNGFVISISFGILLVVYGSLMQYKREFLGHVFITSLVCTAILLCSLFFRRGGYLDKVGEILGNSSFSIYLTHDTFISAWLGYSSRYLGSLNLWFVFFVALMFVVAGGIIIHYAVEKPVVRFVNMCFDRKRKI